MFSFLPLVKVIGKTEMTVENSPVVDKIIVNDAVIKFKLKEGSSTLKEFTLVNFSSKPGINQIHDEIENLPLELMFTTTIDFLDSFSNKFNLSTILFEENTSDNFIEIFLLTGDKLFLPFQLRRPSTKTIYSSVFNLMPVKSNLMAPIEVLSDQYEDYIENALYSFLLNVSKPLREKEHEEYIKSQELLKVLDRIEDLSQIITGQVDNIHERYRAFSRVIAPLIALANLKKKVSDSIKIEFAKNTISYNLQYPIELKSDEIAEYIGNKLNSEQ